MTNKKASPPRRWTFSVNDFDDEDSYVDHDGNEVDYSDAVPWIGTDDEASAEGERRANRWEEHENAFACRVTRHSNGVV